MSYYIWLSYRYLNNPATKSVIEATGELHGDKWPRQFLRVFMCFLVIWLCFLIPYIIPSTRYKLLDAVGWYPVYIPLTILIYVLGVRGYLQLQHKVPNGKKEEKTVSLPEQLITDTVLSLRNSMEQEKLYLEPALNLAALAKHTGIAPKTISAVLNQHLQKSFNEFINEYRIGEIKERLLQPHNKNITIAGLAYECGFNSLPTFQRAFKAVVGVSPTEFIAHQQKTA
jgi:AraC-like DNA-binding protein